MKERNDDKKKNQIRICLDQLYPIYKIKNSKIINCLKNISKTFGFDN